MDSKLTLVTLITMVTIQRTTNTIRPLTTSCSSTITINRAIIPTKDSNERSGPIARPHIPN